MGPSVIQEEWICSAQAAAHYQRAADLEPAGSAARTEAATAAAVRKHMEEGNAALDTDARQAQWYADVAARAVAPALLEPAMLLRCKVRLPPDLCSPASWILVGNVAALHRRDLWLNSGLSRSCSRAVHEPAVLLSCKLGQRPSL